MKNRRIFLQQMGALTAGALLADLSVSPAQAAQPIVHPSSSAKLTIKKSLKFGMIEEKLSVMDKFKLLVDLKFDGVELDSPNDLDEKEILKAQDKTGLAIPGTVCSTHWKSTLSDPDPAVREVTVKAMTKALEDTKKYGGNTVLLVPAVVNEKVGYDQAWERCTAEIKKLIPVAERTGVKIAIENVWNNFLLSPREAAAFIDQFDSKMIGWYFDVGNILRYGWPEHWIRTLGKERILKLDIKEYSRKKMENEGIWKGFNIELLDGDCNWPVVMDALREVQYSGGWGSAEVPGGNRERLAVISERMDRIFAL